MKKKTNPQNMHSLRARNAVKNLRPGIINSTENTVLLSLCDALNSADWYVWPGADRIAEETKLHPRTVNIVRRRLIEKPEKIVEVTPPEVVATILRHWYGNYLRTKRKGVRKAGRPPLTLTINIVNIETHGQPKKEKKPRGRAA